MAMEMSCENISWVAQGATWQKYFHSPIEGLYLSFLLGLKLKYEVRMLLLSKNYYPTSFYSPHPKFSMDKY